MIESLGLGLLDAYIISFLYMFICLLIKKESFFYALFLSLLSALFLMVFVLFFSELGILGLLIFWIGIMVKPILPECDYVNPSDKR